MPLIARWSGRIPAGSVVSELTSSLDWFPTILNLAGARIPADRAIDGVDMQAVLFGSVGFFLFIFTAFFGNCLQLKLI